MNIKLLYIGKNKSNNIETLIVDYEKKIKHFINFKIHCLKNKNRLSQKSLIIKSDSEIILKNIKKDEYVFLLDERGKNYNSLEFSNFLEGNMINGIKNLTFIIGGAYGVDNQLKDLAKNN